MLNFEFFFFNFFLLKILSFITYFNVIQGIYEFLPERANMQMNRYEYISFAMTCETIRRLRFAPKKKEKDYVSLTIFCLENLLILKDEIEKRCLYIL